MKELDLNMNGAGPNINWFVQNYKWFSLKVAGFAIKNTEIALCTIVQVVVSNSRTDAEM